MTRQKLLDSLELFVGYIKNPRKLGIYLCGFVAVCVGGIALSGIGQKQYLHSLGITPVTQQPSAVVGDETWATQFNKKYERGVGYGSLSHIVPRDTPLQTLLSRDIQRDQAHEALVTEMVEAAQRLGLTGETSQTAETTESALNTSVEKQPNKTQRHGVYVGIGPTVNLGDTFDTEIATRVFLELKDLVERIIAIGDIVDINGLNNEFSDLGRYFMGRINDRIDRFRAIKEPNSPHRWRMDLTLLRSNENLGDFSGITSVKISRDAEGKQIEEPRKLTHGRLRQVLGHFGFTALEIGEVAHLAPKYCEMGRLLNLAIKNQATLTELKTALSNILDSQAELFRQDWSVSAGHHSQLRKVRVSGSPAVQVYTPLPVTEAQGSLSWDLKNKELGVGVGKSLFISPNDSIFGLLVGGDVHARCITQPNVGFGGLGIKFFAGPAVNLFH